ncbi:MAG: sigma-70 family RNA polymerase sigma factor [Lentimicrobiaceae bacterium]|jgi:RNA polymerase sigma factor (sigma-70 family)|nr:sigma-70 family RNA polymerase sigma factor [Lentimicrobiaceae bacterium]
MDKENDVKLIEGLRERNNKTISDIYKNYFPPIKQYILVNGGSANDAEDIFQEAVVIIYTKLTRECFTLTSSFFTYLYSICKHLWLQELWKRNKVSQAVYDNKELFDYNSLPIETENIMASIEIERNAMIQKHFLLLGKDCQKILLMSANNMTPGQITEEMHYVSEEYARLRKFKCKEILKKYILRDPNFAKIFEI